MKEACYNGSADECFRRASFFRAVRDNRISWGEQPSIGGQTSSSAHLQMTAQSMEGFAMSKRIPLTQGQFTIVDDADFDWLNQWKWYAARATSTYYAVRKESETDKSIRMHRLLLNPPPGIESDHINGDGLDNRRSNLRLCTRSQNNANRRKFSLCSSRYKGVSWQKRYRNWRARIWISGKEKQLGLFDDEQKAARAYNRAAIALFGEFARLNILPPG